MITGPVLVDTNVLVLYIAGATHRAIIDVHKRCNQFTQEDFDTLIDLLGREPELILLPQVVAEVSNLLAQIGNPFKDALLRTMKAAVLLFREDYVASRLAASRPEFQRLRLTDCALLAIGDGNLHLVTVDLDLYLAFLRNGRSVTNFRHVIDARS